MTATGTRTVLITGNVLDFGGGAGAAEAIAIEGDRIVRTGPARKLRAWAGGDGRIIELPGATLVPGINDAHAHMEREGLKRIRPSLADCRSVADICRRIGELARSRPRGEWIVTMPIGEPPFYFGGPSNLAENRVPDRRDLDAAAPDHPVYIPGLFGNWGEPPGYNCLNSLALAANGIGAESRAEVEGIEILRDAGGNPTGVIVERNPRPMVEFALLKAVPRFAPADRRRGIVDSMRLYNGVGTTSAYEGHGSSGTTIGIYRDLWATGELTVRMGLVISPSWRDMEEAGLAMKEWLAYARGSGIGDEWLRISGVHIAFGGDPEFKRVARRDLPNTGWSGFIEQAHGKAEFEELCHAAAVHGIRVHTIVGDRLEEVVEILERIDARHRLSGRRWVIEHIAHATRDTLQRLARLDCLVTTIPVYYLWKGGHWYDPSVGNDVVAMRTMIELGLDPAAATDNIPYNPGCTLWSMCERIRRTDGAVLGGEERLSREQALRSMTVSGARLTFDEDRKGRLLPGHLADLAVFAEDPLKTGAERLKTLESILTMVGGRIVHGDHRA